MLLPPNQVTLYELQSPSTTNTIILTKKKAFRFFWPNFHIYITKLFKTHDSVTQLHNF